jgi:tRNA-binding protein
MTDTSPAPIKPPVTIEDFSRLDIRVGRIEKLSDVPDSRKLVKLDVSFGDHRRTILAGLKDERDNPAEIEGLQAIFLVNLESRKWPEQPLRGCSWTSATPTASGRCWPYPKPVSRTAHGWADSRQKSLLTRLVVIERLSASEHRLTIAV